MKRDLPVAGAIQSNSSSGVVFRGYRLTQVQVLLKLAGFIRLQRFQGCAIGIVRNGNSFDAWKHGQHTTYNVREHQKKRSRTTIYSVLRRTQYSAIN